jgi:dethiobiotin synthetase
VTPRRYFVAGTDTGVGKTLVAAALLRNAQAFGRRAVAVKPVSAGCAQAGGQLVNEDAVLLQSRASQPLDLRRVNPVALEPAIAPHIAAARAGLPLTVANLAAAVRDVADLGHEALLVEGAGGWLVPLNDRESMADLAAALGYPVILVVAMRLGCLNHALLTAGAIRSTGLPLAGWVANSTMAAMPAVEENIRALEDRLPAPRLGTIPWLGPGATPEQANTWLDGMSLFGGR